MNDRPSNDNPRPSRPPTALELNQLELHNMVTATIIHMMVALPNSSQATFIMLEHVILGTVMSVTKPGKEDELLDGLVAEVKTKIHHIRTLLAEASEDKEPN